MQSVPINVLIESWISARIQEYSIQLYPERRKIILEESEWVVDWLLFSANSAIVQRYNGENKLIFNEMMMKSALF
jgi:hypothetical protein